MIRDIITTVHQTDRERDQAARADRPIRLHPSSCGGCPRKALLHARKYEATPFDAITLERMRLGEVMETATADALQQAWGDNLTLQLPLQTEYWDGTCDFVHNHQTPLATIIEHKATGDKWWDYKGALPREEHLIQLALYGSLYEEIYNYTPHLVLYYISWAKWAEFDVLVRESQITASGYVDGEARERTVNISIPALRAQLETYFRFGDLPPVLSPHQQEGNCTSRGKVWCGYYRHCFNQE
jgi:hypothetical protein